MSAVLIAFGGTPVLASHPTPVAEIYEAEKNGIAEILNNVSIDKLFDGDTREGEARRWGSDNENIVVFRNSAPTDPDAGTTLILRIDLGVERTISRLIVSFYKAYHVMIGLGVENTLTVSASEDGTTYRKVTDYVFDSEQATDARVNGVFDEKILFDEPVTAQYFELTLPYEPSDPSFADGKIMWEFVAMTEINFIDLGSEPVETEPPASTEKPAAPIATEKPSDPPVGTTDGTTASASGSSVTEATPSSGEGLPTAAVIAILAAAAVILAVIVVAAVKKKK